MKIFKEDYETNDNDDYDCCAGTCVKVNVDVPRIVKYVGITAVFIVGIIFGTKCYSKMLEEGFFKE